MGRRSSEPDVLTVVDSRESASTVADLNDHLAVGTALEIDGLPGAPLDPSEVNRFATVAIGAGPL